MSSLLPQFVMDIPNALLIAAFLINSALAVIMFYRHENLLGNRLYLFNILLILFWILTMFWYRNLDSADALLAATSFLYAIPTVIASTFLYISFNFPDSSDDGRWRRALAIFVPNALVLILLFWPNAVIREVALVPGGENSILFGNFYLLYVTYLISYFSLGLGILAVRYFFVESTDDRILLLYLCIGYWIAMIFSLVTNILMPWFGNYSLIWLGHVLTVLMVLPVVYAAYRQTLMAQRIMLTQVFVGILIVLMLFRTMVPQSDGERVFNFIIFIAITSIGLYLIQSVRTEAEAQAKNQELIENLSAANTRLRKLDKQKSEFVSIASHQLRSPLTAILGYASMATQGSFGSVPDELHKNLKKIEHSARVMASSIEDYLNISQIESGEMEYTCEHFDLHVVMTQVCDSLQNEAAQKELTLTGVSNVIGQTTVYADKGKTAQIIYTLITNALQYTEEGSIAVQLYEHGDQSRLYMSVTDTGIGMDEATIRAIFQKFERGVPASTANVHGTGLGLFIAKKMAIRMNGDITAHSGGEGEGSQFIFYLPRTRTSS